MRRRLPKLARELLIRMLAHDGTPDVPAMRELRRRGLVRQTDARVEVTPTGARKLETYGLTARGVQVATQLAENRIGHDLCWETP